MEFRDSSNAATLSARTQCHQCHLHFLKSQKLSRRLSFRESITGKKQILLAHMRKKLKTSTSWISHISEAPRLSLRIDGTPKIGAKCDFLPPLGILLEPRRPWLPWRSGNLTTPNHQVPGPLDTLGPQHVALGPTRDSTVTTPNEDLWCEDGMVTGHHEFLGSVELTLEAMLGIFCYFSRVVMVISWPWAPVTLLSNLFSPKIAVNSWVFTMDHRV